MTDLQFIRPIFVTDKNGDVWKKIGNGYIHRMYGLFWDGDPNDIPDNLKKRIAYDIMIILLILISFTSILLQHAGLTWCSFRGHHRDSFVPNKRDAMIKVEW